MNDVPDRPATEDCDSPPLELLVKHRGGSEPIGLVGSTVIERIKAEQAAQAEPFVLELVRRAKLDPISPARLYPNLLAQPQPSAGRAAIRAQSITPPDSTMPPADAAEIRPLLQRNAVLMETLIDLIGEMVTNVDRFTQAVDGFRASGDHLAGRLVSAGLTAMPVELAGMSRAMTDLARELKRSNDARNEGENWKGLADDATSRSPGEAMECRGI